MNYQEHVDAMRANAVKIGQTAVYNYLLSRAPILAFGPINAFVNAMITIVIKILIEKTEFGIFFKYVDMRVDRQGSAFDEIAKRWYLANDEEKKKLEAEYLEKFYNLARLTT